MNAKPLESGFGRRMAGLLAPLAFCAACAQPAERQDGPVPDRESAAAAPTPPPEDVESQIPASFRALGTEPFWAITSGGSDTGAGLSYSTPENIEGTPLVVEDQIVQPTMRRLTGTMDGKAFTIELTVGQCSDGMSDRVYPFTTRLSIDGEVMSGCARPMDG